MNSIYIYIIIMAVTTYLIRMIPLVFFRKKVENRFFKDFLYYVPYACLASMTFPAILYASESFIACVIGLITALVSACKGVSMVKVAIFSCVAVYVTEAFIRIL